MSKDFCSNGLRCVMDPALAVFLVSSLSQQLIRSSFNCSRPSGSPPSSRNTTPNSSGPWPPSACLSSPALSVTPCCMPCLPPRPRPATKIARRGPLNATPTGSSIPTNDACGTPIGTCAIGWKRPGWRWSPPTRDISSGPKFRRRPGGRAGRASWMGSARSLMRGFIS
jgi:hypothetical protein